MLRLRRWSFLPLFVLFVILFNSVVSFAQPKEEEVLKAMKKASHFMMDSVSNRGGFLEFYSDDFSMQWGEVPARKSMIWLYGSNTVEVGMMYLDVYEATGDPVYLEYAKKTANAIVWGQHPLGGWHYFIDFDMTGTQKWYDDVLSKMWGFEEFYHYYGNCTYDDNTTIGPARFLLRLYMTTLEPSYRIPLLKALDFVLMSQYPNGAWPQRYPLRYEFSHGGFPDYSSCYTFNDEVIQGNIFFLIEAWEKLGNEEYKKAAYRGMDFVVISQLAPPQAGWAAQYDMEIKPAQGRSYEPPSVMPRYTIQNIHNLMDYYKITGDRRYLKGIPDAIEWLENSSLPEDKKITREYTHAIQYEPETNKPIYVLWDMQNHRTWVSYEPEGGGQTTVDVDALKREYERINALSPEQSMNEYKSKKSLPKSFPHIEPERVRTLITSMDNRGDWIEEISKYYVIKYHIENLPDVAFKPPKKIMGIATRTYISNMRTMIHYIQNLKDNK